MLAENPDFSLKPCSEMEDKMTEQESEVIGSAGLQLSRRTRADDRYQRGAGIPHRRGCSQSGRLSSRATIHRRSRAASFRAPAQVAYPVDGSTFVGGPVGFPSGGHTTTTIKVAEARSLAEAGADELDMMINLGRFKSGDLSCVRDEIKAVVEMIKPVPLKVIIEVSRLTDDEIQRASESAVEAGAVFVKTGTGWTGETTTLQHIRIIGAVVRGHAGSKRQEGSATLQPSKACSHLE